MNHNPMRTLPPRAFHLAGLINVQKVYMRNCSLDDLDPTALAGLVILIELDLSENNIYELKDGTFLVSCLNVNTAQCENDRIFLSFRFYMKSKRVKFRVILIFFFL